MLVMTGPLQHVSTRLSQPELDALQRWITTNDGATLSGALRLAARQLVADAEPDGPAGRRGPAPDRSTLLLGTLLDALNRAGLTGHLGEARRLLARAVEVGHEVDAQARRAADERDALVDALAAGNAKLDRLSAPFDGDALKALADRAVTKLRGHAVTAARTEVQGVHAELSKRAATVIARSVAAGNKLLDTKRHAKLLLEWAPPHDPRRGDRPATLIIDDTLRTRVTAQIPEDADPAAVAEATVAWRALGPIWATVDALHGFAGGRSTLFDESADQNLINLVELQPAAVRLAIADAAGLRPGLRAALRPAVGAPPAGRDVVGGVAVPAGWAPPAGSNPPPGWGAR